MTPAPRIRPKWRPSLGLVVFSVLLAVLALPATVVIWFRAVDDTSSRIGPVETGAMVVALLLTLLVAYVLTRTITRPIDALVARADAIGKGGRAAIQPLDRYGTREIARLSQSLLDLAANLVDRSEYVRSFASHVSHELKSPLTAIKGAAELLRDDDPASPMTPEERRRFLDHLVADVDRLDGLLSRLRDLARADLPLEGGETDLAAVAATLRRRVPDLDITVDGNPVLPLPLEAAAIVFGHLADNAAQHGATHLVLSARPRQGRVAMTVTDNGTGISEGNRPLVFQPFFSTRREEGGTGMGLDIARTMLLSHGGSIRLLDTTPGASFEITLPAASSASRNRGATS